MTETIGLCAAILTTTSFLPQTLMVIRSGNTDGISVIMYSMFTIGVSCWLAYGVVTQTAPIVLSNTVTLCFAITILSLKLRSIAQNRRKAMAL
ncbi:MAG: SemiSWEET transporter [Pseudomonadota bacterium]